LGKSRSFLSFTPFSIAGRDSCHPNRKRGALISRDCRLPGRAGDDANMKMKNTTSSNFSHEPVPKDFLNKLGEMHRAERELTLALPLVVAAAESKDLKTLLNLHLKETRSHVKALEKAAKSLDVELPAKSCKQMTQFIKEAVKVIGQRLIAGQQDAELIAVGQKIERFEIDSYTPLLETARKQQFTHEYALLTSILSQEKLAFELLGQLGAGKGPLKKLIEKVSLSKAGAKGG
jgi:ferritin-like metal-binding protein YciE